MAWTSADVTAGERTLLAADKPVMVAIHALESPQIARWDADGSLAAGSDISATDWPATRSYDRLTGLRTKPNAAAATQWLAFRLAASPKDIDCIFIQDHNFGTITGLTVTVEIADTSDFVTGLKEIESWSPGTSNKRLASFDLNHAGSGSANAQRYSGVGFLRVKIAGGSHTPEIGEVWVGRRTQLRYKADVPWDPDNYTSDVADHVTRSGITTRTVRHRGKRVIDALLAPDVAADRTDIITWFRDTSHGTKPFIWCEDPSTAPSNYNIMLLDDPELSFPFIGGPSQREITIAARENGPDFLELGV